MFKLCGLVIAAIFQHDSLRLWPLLICEHSSAHGNLADFFFKDLFQKINRT